MPIFEQGYRRYEGPVRKTSRALPIAWESIRPRMRWWVWVMLFLSLFWPYLIFAVMVFVFSMTSAALGKVPIPPSTRPVFDAPDLIEPTRLMGVLSNGSPGLFWEVLNDSMKVGWPLFLTAIAAAGILASDRRTDALQLYFARPVLRRDYFAGKLAATGFFAFLVTAAPSILLWLECAATSTDRGYLVDTWWFPFAIVAASALYAAWCAGLVLLLSAIIPRPSVVGILAIFLFLFMNGLGPVLGKVLHDKSWRLISPAYALGGLTAPLFGLDCPDWLPWWRCALVGIGFPAAALAIVRARVRAVEVVT